jgi:hypothetical protein
MLPHSRFYPGRDSAPRGSIVVDGIQYPQQRSGSQGLGEVSIEDEVPDLLRQLIRSVEDDWC